MDSEVIEGNLSELYTFHNELTEIVELLERKCNEQEKDIQALRDELKTQSNALRAFATTTTETLQHVDHNQREIVRAINNGLKLEEPGDANGNP